MDAVWEEELEVKDAVNEEELEEFVFVGEAWKGASKRPG